MKPASKRLALIIGLVIGLLLGGGVAWKIYYEYERPLTPDECESILAGRPATIDEVWGAIDAETLDERQATPMRGAAKQQFLDRYFRIDMSDKSPDHEAHLSIHWYDRPAPDEVRWAYEVVAQTPTDCQLGLISARYYVYLRGDGCTLGWAKW